MTVVSRRKKRLNGSSRHGYVICILEVYRDMPSALYFIVTTPGLQSIETAIVLQSIEMTSALHSIEMTSTLYFIETTPVLQSMETTTVLSV